MSVFRSAVAKLLKKTLDKIIDDPSDGFEKNLIFPKYLKVDSMDEAYIDDLEMAGPTLAKVKAEGQEMAFGDILQGFTTRYTPTTFAMRMTISKELMRDNKYDQAIRAARRLKRIIYKTAEYDAANVLIRMFDTNYVGGDGVPLVSNAHTLPRGGTWSNAMASPASPSKVALTAAVAQIKKIPGHDGLLGSGISPKKIVFPTEQWGIWHEILGQKNLTLNASQTSSGSAANTAQFAEFNTFKSAFGDVEGVEVLYWTNTTTQWGIITDAENGMRFLWRQKPESQSWVENSQLNMSYSVDARWTTGWSDARGFYGVQA